MSFAGVRRHVERGDVSARRIVDPVIERRLMTGLPDNRPATLLMRTIQQEIHSVSAELVAEARWSIAD